MGRFEPYSDSGSGYLSHSIWGNQPSRDYKSLYRAIWSDGDSKYLPYEGGQHGAGAGVGDSGYSWNQPEGWFPRIGQGHYNNTIGQIAQGDGSTAFSYTFLQTSSNDTDTFDLCCTDRWGDIIQLTGSNSRQIGQVMYTNSSTDDSEIYTDNWTGVDVNSLLTACPSESFWYFSVIVKRVYESTQTNRFTFWMFGVSSADGGTTYGYNDADGNNIVNATSTNGGTWANPATGGSAYYSGKHTLPNDWTKYEMYFKLDPQYKKTHLTVRIDLDDSYPSSGNQSRFYILRPTLHPYNVGLKHVNDPGSTNNLNGADFGNYNN